MIRTSLYFGELTFNKKVMVEKLPEKVYEKLIMTIDKHLPLDQNIASDVAHAMKEWALEKGATHFAHWFQPLRSGTAEKHDSFICYSEAGNIIERFSAEQLIQSEPDASSFPSGGIRSTFEARGYTAWDPTSPVFILASGTAKTLVIPSVFLSWTGDVLDNKTPLLRSQKILNDKAMKLQKLLGNKTIKRIKVYGGLEQEYFLILRDHWKKRPDLRNCQHTLFGAPPSKGQQMEDHYFGSMNTTVLKFMDDLEHELYQLGIPVKTRHNEVSPNQFEIAPLYEEINLAVDHNLLLMDIMKKTAEKHNLVALLHEKPFAFVNGSGKHLNWSVGDNMGNNYFEPSESPVNNINFLMSITAFLAGVQKYGGLLRSSVAEPGNDHRLGANEAPPAIMSVYLGDYLNKIFDSIEQMTVIDEITSSKIVLGVRNLPRINKDVSDRNRTSPLAFTGNKFEFRAVGSSQNAGESATILNFMLAYGYDLIYNRLTAMKGNIKTNVLLVIRDILKESKAVRFEGNNYTKEWQEEAHKRQLPNAKNTPQALRYYLEPEIIQTLSEFKILNEKELNAKYEIKLDTYLKIKKIEFNTAVKMIKTLYLPAINRYLKELSSTALNLNQLNLPSKSINHEIEKLENLYSMITLKTEEMQKILNLHESKDNAADLAHFYAEMTELTEIRTLIDQAEENIANDLWPVPKYSTMFEQL